MRRRRVASLTLVAVVLVVAGCDNDDGREMQSPGSLARFRLSETTTSTSTTTTTVPALVTPVTLSSSTTSTTATIATSSSTLAPGSTTPTTSPGSAPATLSASASSVGAAGSDANLLQFAGPWDDGAAIPVEFTCDGTQDVPLITWTAPPEGTAELALSVVDPDADGFVHWLVVGLPPEAGSVGGGEPPVAGATEVANSFGDIGWGGPCPPPGDGPHTYQFTLHVLDQALELPNESPTNDLLAATEAATAERATFAGTYERA